MIITLLATLLIVEWLINSHSITILTHIENKQELTFQTYVSVFLVAMGEQLKRRAENVWYGFMSREQLEREIDED